MEKEISYKHAGMIQLTPQGQMAFLHHTADSKWDPRQQYAFYGQPISFVTFPLNPEQASKVFLDGWLWPDKIVIREKHECPSEPGLKLWNTIARCNFESREEDDGKIPILEAESFPELIHLVEEAFRVFQDWQVTFFKNTNPISLLFED